MWKSRLKTRLEDVERRLSTAEQQLRTFDLTIADVLDKVKRWMHRALRRNEREDAAENPPSGPPTRFTDPISQRLLERRMRSLAGKLPTEEDDDGVLRR